MRRQARTKEVKKMWYRPGGFPENYLTRRSDMELEFNLNDIPMP